MTSLEGLLTAAVLGTGCMSGVFFAFSTFVMAGLVRLPSAQGIAAMQSINVKAVRPVFMIALFGTAALCAVIGVAALFSLEAPHPVLMLVGSATYLLGTILVTIAGNVPLNNALARLVPGQPDTARQWRRFVFRWLLFNHVRTLSALGSAAVFLVALVVSGAP
ncbi:DUF1772 domain-containing protein [soil metagenome]